MNYKNILICGFVAGLVINISAITMVPVVGNQMNEALAIRGLPPLSNMAMLYFCLMSFCLGFLLVFLYVFLRPLLGERIRAALVISTFVWFLAFLLNNASLIAYGFIPVKLVVLGMIWGFFELLISGVIGAMLYKRISRTK